MAQSDTRPKKQQQKNGIEQKKMAEINWIYFINWTEEF